MLIASNKLYLEDEQENIIFTINVLFSLSGNPVKQHPAVPIEEVLWLNKCVEEN